MFPIPFNFPFRKANGDISTIGAEINAGGGGSSYTLPTASANTKGGVKIGEGLTMDGEVLKNTNPTPATPYTLPTASAETLGGVKVGEGLNINESGVLSASGGGGGSTIGFTDSHSYTISSGNSITQTLSDVPSGKKLIGCTCNTAGLVINITGDNSIAIYNVTSNNLGANVKGIYA